MPDELGAGAGAAAGGASDGALDPAEGTEGPGWDPDVAAPAWC